MKKNNPIKYNLFSQNTIKPVGVIEKRGLQLVCHLSDEFKEAFYLMASRIKDKGEFNQVGIQDGVELICTNINPDYINALKEDSLLKLGVKWVNRIREG